MVNAFENRKAPMGKFFRYPFNGKDGETAWRVLHMWVVTPRILHQWK